MHVPLLYIIGFILFSLGVILFFYFRLVNVNQNKLSLKAEKINELNTEITNQNHKQEILKKEFENKIESKEFAIQILEEKIEQERLQFTTNQIEREKIFSQLKEQFSNEFKVLSNTIFEEKTKQFSELSAAKIKNILKPLDNRISSFEETIEKTYLRENEERIGLKKEIEQLFKLNNQLSFEANNLASALKGDSKTQGDWGEIQLDKILEKSGLTKNIHFSTQQTYLDDEENQKRPDIIIHLPEKKFLIIDAKVSLKSYVNYNATDDKELKKEWLKKHISSIKRHIKDLGSKKYQNLSALQSPDYVLMFVPIESALSLALMNDEQLYFNAMEKNVILVSTSTLLATMKTVSYIWKQEDQKKNVQEIARQSAALYDKFVLFTDDLLKIGKQLDQTKTTYDGAINKLTSGKDNLIRKTQRLQELGVETKKSINTELLDKSTLNNLEQ